MTISDLIKNHTICDHPNGPSVEALKQFAIELLGMVKNEATVQNCVIPDFLEMEVNEALEELRK